MTALRFRGLSPLAPLLVSCLAAVAMPGCSSDDSNKTPAPTSSTRTSCADAAHPTYTPEPVSGVGPESLGDADSDGNGLLDRDEWGPIEVVPLDTDEDGIADYEDHDDDGDGLPDVTDPDRLVPLAPRDPLAVSETFATGTVVELDPRAVVDAARPGDTIVIRGSGMSCDALVTFEGGDATVSAWPVAASADEIEVVVPTGAGDTVALVTGEVRSNPIRLTMLDDGAPLLAIPERPSASVGSRLTFHGTALGDVDAVLFGDVEVTPLATTADTVEVEIPADATGDEVQLRAGDVVSNTIELRAATPASLTVTAPSGVSPTVVAFGPTDEASLPSSSVEVPIHGTRVLTVHDDSSPLLMAMTAPGMTSVTVDPRSTAVALVAQINGSAPRLANDSLGDYLSLVEALPDIDALAASIEAAVSADPATVWSEPSEPLLTGLAEAALALQLEVDAAIEAGTLQLKPGDTMPFNGHVPVALITPGTPQHDIAVSQVADQTNIRVVNDTQLNVSVQIRDTDKNVVLQHHAGWGFGKSVVGGQGPLTTLFKAKNVPFDQPRGRDAAVEIVTPGVLEPGPDSALGVQTQRMLQLRTVIDKIVWPLFTEVLEVKVKPEFLFEIFKSQAPGATSDFLDNMDKGLVVNAIGVVKDALLRDLQNTGPITQALYMKLGEKFAAALVKQLGIKMIPVLNGIHTALQVGGSVVGGTDAVKTGVDLATTPGVLDWTVLFGLGISKVHPTTIKKLDVDVQNIELFGNGFYPKYDANQTLQIPTVTFTDTDPTGFGTYVAEWPANKFTISPDGTHLSRLELPRAYARIAVGPITVRIDHAGDSAQAPDPLLVDTDFVLTSLSPNMGSEDDQVVVTGTDFADDIRFELVDAMAPETATPISATLLSHDETSATIVIPTLTSGISQWYVRAWQHGLLGMRSNGLLFVKEGGAHQLVPIGSTDPGWYTQAIDVADDGTVVGISYEPQSNGKVFTWTQGGGLQTVPYASDPSGVLRGLGLTGRSNGGMIVGDFTDGQVYQGGSVTALAPATPINAGEVCGSAISSAVSAAGTVAGSVTCGPQGFFGSAYASTWQPHGYLAPGFTGGNDGNTYARAISDGGTAVGCANITFSLLDPVLFNGGTAQKLPTPMQYASSCANGVNDAGQIVGHGSNGGPSTGLFWSSATAMPIAVTSPVTSIIDINDVGVMLGGQAAGGGGVAAPIYISSDGAMTWTAVGGDPVDVNGVTYVVIEARAINDSGIIAATAEIPLTGETVAVALIPGG